MILPIVKYGHPALRQKGARVSAVTPEIRQFVEDLLETMYDREGIGLAAQQVARPLQVCVVDVRQVKERPSTLEVKGEAQDIAAFMPMTLINPELTPVGEPVSGPEGCLSFPEIYADVTRPSVVDVRALDLKGQIMEFRCGGLLARAIQHEWDHLQGILFIDRMDQENKEKIRPEYQALQAETKKELAAAKKAVVRAPSLRPA